MKTQELKAISALPIQELQVQYRELEEKLLKLRFAHSTAPLKNGVQLQTLRRHRARLLTWIRQKELQAKADQKKADQKGKEAK